VARITHCKSCDKETLASLCNICFLEEVIEAVERGETDASKILQGMSKKYGRLQHIRKLPAYQKIFGPTRIRRVVTTEEGDRCRLVMTLDGVVAVCRIGEKRTRIKPIPEFEEDLILETAEGSRIHLSPTYKETTLPMESTEGKRVVTYLEGDVPIHQYTTPTALISTRSSPKKVKRAKSKAPSKHLA